MKRILISAALLFLAGSAPALAAEGAPPPPVPGKTFEQRQAHMLKMLDQRIVGLQEDKTCVQAAKNDEDLRACRGKHQAEMREKRGEMKHRHEMMGNAPLQ